MRRAANAAPGAVDPAAGALPCLTLRGSLVTFTDLAFDGTRLVWRITHYCHAVPGTMAGPANLALASLDAGNGGPVVFEASNGGAVALHSGAVPFGAGPAARVLAQACARLTPPGRLVLIGTTGDGPLLAATLLLPWTSDADDISAADLAALAAVASLRSDSGAVDPGLIRMAWSARPAVVTSLLPGLVVSGGPELATVHECILGLAAAVFGGSRRRVRALASTRRRVGATGELAVGQTQP
jgi:hypothetical protein